MKIVFCGDIGHPNARSWIDALRSIGGCEVITWSLPTTSDRGGRFARLAAALAAVTGLRRFVRASAPDVLIGYRLTSYGFLAALTGFHPLVVACQGETDVWPLNTWSTPVKRRMATLALRRADLVHAWGEHMAATSVALGAPAEKILVQARGVDLQRFTLPEAPTTDVLRLVVTRSLFPEYRHALIIEAVANVASRGIPVYLEIAGDGASKTELQELAARLGIRDRVTFHGSVEPAMLPALLRRCNVYVSMPITEGVSASLFEAMACGCFPIVSDLPANRFWIRPDENGTLVPVDDRRRLEDALVAAWNNRNRLVQSFHANRSLVEKRASLHHNIRHFVDAYERLLLDRRACQRPTPVL